jgi:hypothetical protein
VLPIWKKIANPRKLDILKRAGLITPVKRRRPALDQLRGVRYGRLNPFKQIDLSSH